MAFVSQIIQQHPDAGYWHQQYPWFSIGQLVNAANNIDTPAFTESARRTALFFNDIPRLHWLLYQQDTDISALHALIYPDTGTLETQNVSAKAGNTNGSPEQPGEVVEQEKSAMPENPDTVVQSFTSVVAPKETANVVKKPLVEDDYPGQTVNAPITQPTIANNFFDPTIANTWETEEPEDAEPEEPELIPLPTSMLSESLAQAADSYRKSSLDEDAMVFKTAYQHTIDYFASQGIKLDGEPAKDDRFGQQVKTFTSWLRQMKRLPDAPMPEADPLVEVHAAHSLQKGEVVTESMADVLLKQGKIGHALAVLEKLRLLHPQKSHYFATRIEQIKHL